MSSISRTERNSATSSSASFSLKAVARWPDGLICLELYPALFDTQQFDLENQVFAGQGMIGIDGHHRLGNCGNRYVADSAVIAHHLQLLPYPGRHTFWHFAPVYLRCQSIYMGSVSIRRGDCDC